MVRILRFALLLFSTVLAGPPATAQQVHVLMVGDTRDKDSGADSQSDLATLRSFFERVRDSGISVEVTEVKDETFSCSSILSAVSMLRVGETDTIIFYYSGHGSRAPNAPTKFPEFWCQRFAGDTNADLSGVVDQIEAMKPRLTIAIADTCNTVERKKRSRETLPLQEEPLPQNVTRAMRHLLLEYVGTVVLSASIPGQNAWGDGYGSLFTRQLFRQSIPRVINANDGNIRPRWEAIIVDALRDFKIPDDPPAVQYPQVATWGLAERWPMVEGVSPPTANSNQK